MRRKHFYTPVAVSDILCVLCSDALGTGYYGIVIDGALKKEDHEYICRKVCVHI
jgi:hypothetical protein